MDPATDILMFIGLVIGSATVVAGALYKVYQIAKKIDQAIGVDKQGMTLAERHAEQADDLKDMNRRLRVLEQAIMPEGRTPLPTRVDKLEQDVNGLQQEVSKVGVKVDTLTGLVIKDIEERA